MLNWLIGKHVKKEIKSHLNELHLHLSHSFLNIKKDISNIHTHLSHRDKKILELEAKIALVENKLLYLLQFKEEPKKLKNIEEEEISIEKIPISLSSLTSITYTQKEILKALYELQNQLNSPISFKSIAKYMYPGKKYNAVRTTLSEYLDTLSAYNLIRKDKIGRETIAVVTKKGEILAKDLIKNDKAKKRLRIEE